MDSSTIVKLNNLFNNIEYLIQKGKGYSIYNASANFLGMFIDEFNHYVNNYQIVNTSNLSNAENIADSIPIIVYQDLDYFELLKVVDILANKIIFPAWFKGCTVFFISKLDKAKYIVEDLQSVFIHSNYTHVINLLLLEQMNNLLNLMNVTITSPAMINYFDDTLLYTPIELIFRDKLIENNISFTPQVKLGRYYVDFLLDVNSKKIIVECDGRDYHNPYLDKERDEVISREGYQIHRFSGSSIYNNCQKCIDEILLNQNPISNIRYALEELNEDQIAAVNHICGPMRVLAPAGSGKTKTLVNRIVNLINNGVSEHEILALAFNKKAKDEITQRMYDRYGINLEIRTFHSLGNSIVKDALKWTFDGNKQEIITRNLLEKAVKKHIQIEYKRNKDPLDEYMAALSMAKNDLLSFDKMIIEKDNRIINFEPVFNEYLKLMVRHNFYNFDDMIYIAVRLLLSKPELRRKYQSKYKYILVDEFQDLNRVQLLMLQILGLPENNIFIVGDDDQMIYGYRGAEIRNILEFNKRYAITKDQVLRINYRSCCNIVRHSKWLIDHNQARVPKDITPFSQEKGDIKLFVGDDLSEQAETIAQWILKQKNDNNRWSDFAVLFRYNQYHDLLYMVLSKFNIPVFFDGIKIFNSGVGRCILSYLTIIYDRNRATAKHYEIILKKPNKYFTNEFISTIQSWDDFINLEHARNSLREMDINKYEALVNKLTKLSENIAGQSADSIVTTIIEEFELKQFYKDESKLSEDVDTATDYDILEIIMSFAKGFGSIDDFYNYCTDLSKKSATNGTYDNNDTDKVKLSSIHKAKGNEFSHVAYFNVVKRITEKAAETELEEERRISYVAVTRPRESLIITTQKDEISTFVKEFFLNPKYKTLNIESLKNSLGLMDININKLRMDLQTIEDLVNEILDKYPELKGESPGSGGLLERLKLTLRKPFINKALKQLHVYNEQQSAIYNEITTLQKEKYDITKDIKYRNELEDQNNLQFNGFRTSVLF